MNKTSGYHDMEIAEYYATRGKLTNLNVIHDAHAALTYASHEGHLDIVKHYLQREQIRILTTMATPLIGPLGKVVWRS